MTMPTGAHSNAYFYDIAGFSDPRIIEAGLHRTKEKRAAVGCGLPLP
jgi:hypothetical protein